jgi:hypothetical protein
MGLAALALVLALAGCATRELVLRDADAPWTAEGVTTVEVPTFEAEPAAWAIADRARGEIREALARGTVRVVEAGGSARLVGAVSSYLEHATPDAPRRILRQASSTGPLPIGPNLDTYAWEMDVSHGVQLRLVLRVVRRDGAVAWTRESVGEATEVQAVALNWPGNDPAPPPATLPRAPDQALFQRLRDRALAQALEPLLDAVTVRYEYRELR